jgi:type VI secretion system protein ImpK
MESERPEPDSLQLDELLQQTWLLAFAIRNGKLTIADEAIYQQCLDHIQQVQDTLLKKYNASDFFRDEIKFAQCVFIDEAVMNTPEVDSTVWYRKDPIQARLLHSIDGGEHFYERIKKLLHEPKPSPALLTCYYRMLLLGYRGKYHEEDDPERQSLVKQLRERLPPAESKINKPIFIRSTRPDIRFWRRSPWLMRGLALLFIAAITCGMSTHLHYLLGQWYTQG